MIRLIASDMDGTLLDPEKQLPPQLPALMAELYRRDVVFAVASGRSRVALTSLFGNLAEETFFLCDNGACVIVPHRPPILTTLPQQAVRQVLDLCRTLPHTVPVLCAFHHIDFPEDAAPAVQEEISRFYRNFRAVPYTQLYQMEEPVLKIALCDPQTLKFVTVPAVRDALGDAYEQIVSGACWMDVMQTGVTKGAALQQLQQCLGVSAAETMVFGDYDNDTSMFLCAAHSYAMANAPERVRNCAKFCAPSNAENGVIRVICEQLGIRLQSLCDA